MDLSQETLVFENKIPIILLFSISNENLPHRADDLITFDHSCNDDISLLCARKPFKHHADV